MKKFKISVIGLGFVGLSLAVVNANLGFKTVGIDIDQKKLKNLQKGKPDFFEPNIAKFLKNSLKKKTVSFSDNLEKVLNTDLTFVTVGTPSTPNGQINLKNLHNVVSQLSKILEKKKTRHLVVIKSTVIPTTTLKTIIPLFRKNKNVVINTNPEFLREGNAVYDLIHPHLIVIGSNRKNDSKFLRNYYEKFYQKLPEVLETDLTTAEMIKYSNNVFLATKISFINTIANICQNLPSVDVNQIAYAIGKDPRIGMKFLQAGPGFGGSCLPKDLSALIKFSNKFGNTNQLLHAVENVNKLQHSRVINLLEQMGVTKKKNRIAILGLAFKKDTDDIRESISIKIVKSLLKRKFEINVHDPMAIQNFQKIFKNKINYFKKISDCLKNTDCCIVLTDWKEYANLNSSIFSKTMRTKNIIDARRVLDPKKFNKFNFKAIGLGSVP